MMASEIGELNKLLGKWKTEIVLRDSAELGTRPKWLGIPLVWWQMSQAKASWSPTWEIWSWSRPWAATSSQSPVLENGVFHIGQ